MVIFRLNYKLFHAILDWYEDEEDGKKYFTRAGKRELFKYLNQIEIVNNIPYDLDLQKLYEDFEEFLIEELDARYKNKYGKVGQSLINELNMLTVVLEFESEETFFGETETHYIIQRFEE